VPMLPRTAGATLEDGGAPYGNRTQVGRSHVEPIFDRAGRPVAWFQGVAVIDFRGRYVAFDREGALYSYGGRFLGRLDDGLIRDKAGDIVAFLAGASGGVDLPSTADAPPAPVAPDPPPPPAVSTPPPRPAPKDAWSGRGWEGFLSR
jgi:hypothetical protein